MSQVSGLVIRLSGSRPFASVRESLGFVEGLELGDAPDVANLPAVLEAPTAARSEDRVRDLEAVDGVARVDVVFVSCEESGTSAPGDDGRP